MTPASRSDYRYIVTFMMKKSRYAMVFPLCKKSDATKAFNRYNHDVELECMLDVKVLRSDNGGEN
uniref:Integrase catalytic domain-containing protein n=1 Tax=Peronospora matthiolae TaxID=2874970 RepID=A0AAV1TYM2_9STRA